MKALHTSKMTLGNSGRPIEFDYHATPVVLYPRGSATEFLGVGSGSMSWAQDATGGNEVSAASGWDGV